MNIIKREMIAHWKSLIIWSIAVFFMIASSMVKYAGMSTTGQSINELFAQMPKSMQAIMGIGTFDLTTASGFFGVTYIYLVVMGTIHAAMLGATMISKEERDQTAEFLLVKPVSRSQIIMAKLIATLINIIVLNGITTISSIVLVNYYSDGEAVNNDILLLMIGMFLLQLLFMVIGTSIAAINKRPKIATSLSTGILLLTFILSVAIDLKENLEWLKYVTPFKYFDAKSIMYGGGLDFFFIFLSIVMIAALLGATFYFYKNRDINI